MHSGGWFVQFVSLLCTVSRTTFNAACCVLVPHAGPSSVTVDQRRGSSSSSGLKHDWLILGGLSINCKLMHPETKLLWTVHCSWLVSAVVRQDKRSAAKAKDSGQVSSSWWTSYLMQCAFVFRREFPLVLLPGSITKRGGGPCIPVDRISGQILAPSLAYFYARRHWPLNHAFCSLPAYHFFFASSAPVMWPHICMYVCIYLSIYDYHICLMHSPTINDLWM